VATIHQKRKEWEETALRTSLEKRGERKERFETGSDLEVDTVYSPDNVRQIDYLEELGFPGNYPFTRGIHPSMYRSRVWTMRLYSGYASAAESNRRYRYLLRRGQTGLSVAFDLPTQMGYDSDHSFAEGEVGKTGVAIDSIEDMAILFRGIPLDKVSTSMTINATAAVLLAMYYVAAERQGVLPHLLLGTVQNDILKEYIARGTYIFPPGPSMRLTTDVFSFCRREMPKWNTISISGYHIREAGANAVQELAFTLANAIAYVEHALTAGLNVDDFAGRISFFFNSHSDFFEEIAKFRAARRLWAKIMKERFGAKDPRSMMLRFHTQTAGSTLTAQQCDNNVVRVTLQAMAAALGGTQSLHTNSRDEALGLPTDDAARLALRTQQVIAYESGITDTVDPLGGSYYVEWLTTVIEEEVVKYLEKIDSLGGALKAISLKFFQKEIERSAYRYQQEVEKKEKIVVGVNEFSDTEESTSRNLLKVDPKIRISQTRKLRRLRSSRNQSRVQSSLVKLRKKAVTEENLMPYIIDAVKCGATLGEICDGFRDVFGVYDEKP
jgi:methylmalonyl-CoA mutase N-terminal domain/subunit